ncbi:MAG: hypothetical protein KDA05_02805 [Phycisphaerales bacterium]|nr:hypothetical protein [Phycisphaerales bacterium]
MAACSTPEARFSTIQDLPAELRSSVALRLTSWDEDEGYWMQLDVDQRLAGDLLERPVLIPFEDERPWSEPGRRGRPIVRASIWPVGDGAPMVVPAVVDTGAASTLILSRDAARRVDAWLSAEIGPHEGIGFVGPVPAGIGLVRRLEIGPLSLAPAEVKVNTEQAGVSASVGLSAFMVFGGLVFDWENHVIVALPRGRPVRIDPGWAEVAWGPMPRVDLREAQDGGTSDSGDVGPSWSIRQTFSGMPVVQAAIAGKPLRTVLDTGGDGHLASLRPLAVDERGRRRLVGSHGRIRAMREHTLDGVVRIGSVEFANPTVVVPDPGVDDKGESEASLQYFDAVIGVELLRRQPVWFDFERAAVRFWTGEGALPALAGSR